MWTLASNMATEWTPRTCLRTKAEAAETANHEISAPVMQALLDALAPFDEARIAVADALRRLLKPQPGGSP